MLFGYNGKGLFKSEEMMDRKTLVDLFKTPEHFCWFCDNFVPCVIGKKIWKAKLETGLQENSIFDIVSKSDFAFVVMKLVDNYDKWSEEAEREGIEVPKEISLGGASEETPKEGIDELFENLEGLSAEEDKDDRRSKQKREENITIKKEKRFLKIVKYVRKDSEGKEASYGAAFKEHRKIKWREEKKKQADSSMSAEGSSESNRQDTLAQQRSERIRSMGDADFL